MISFRITWEGTGIWLDTRTDCCCTLPRTLWGSFWYKMCILLKRTTPCLSFSSRFILCCSTGCADGDGPDLAITSGRGPSDLSTCLRILRLQVDRVTLNSETLVLKQHAFISVRPRRCVEALTGAYINMAEKAAKRRKKVSACEGCERVSVEGESECSKPNIKVEWARTIGSRK